MGDNDYGLKTWDADGNVLLDYTDRIGRLVWHDEIAQNETSNTTVSEIDGLDTVQFSYDLSGADGGGLSSMSHKVTRSGTTVTWTSRGGPSTEDSYIFVLIY